MLEVVGRTDGQSSGDPSSNAPKKVGWSQGGRKGWAIKEEREGGVTQKALPPVGEMGRGREREREETKRCFPALHQSIIAPPAYRRL